MPSEDAVGRATLIARSCLGRDDAVERVEHGESNDVWFAGDIVLRVAAEPGNSDLRSEARLVARLDRSVGYPAVLGSGIHDGHEWMATRRLPGHNLAAVWHRLGFDDRAAAIADLWTRLTAVHATDIDGLNDHAATPFYQLDHDTAVHELHELRVFDPATLHSLEEILNDGFDAIARQPIALAHTDAGPGNTVWDGRRAIPVDFEFACLAPSDLDIDNVARSLAHDAVDQLERSNSSSAIRSQRQARQPGCALTRYCATPGPCPSGSRTHRNDAISTTGNPSGNYGRTPPAPAGRPRLSAACGAEGQ